MHGINRTKGRDALADGAEVVEELALAARLTIALQHIDPMHESKY